MTMKMIRSTSKMSISGTTFISAIAPPLLSPTCIPIELLLSAVPSEYRAGRVPRRCGKGAAFNRQKLQQTNGRLNHPRRLIGLRRRRRRCTSLVPFGQEAHLIDSRGADFIHDRDHITVLGARIT